MRRRIHGTPAKVGKSEVSLGTSGHSKKLTDRANPQPRFSIPSFENKAQRLNGCGQMFGTFKHCLRYSLDPAEMQISPKRWILDSV
jgi:hypothetical protein